ncbi:MAG TPA: hypothetical protein VFW63_11325 [Acidimicrobiales bacterium]|nr:hypothetical protein [Acidimicrobiales bacterium]
MRRRMVLRRGPGLRLGLRGRRRLVVTVDDAHDAAARLASLSGSHRG